MQNRYYIEPLIIYDEDRAPKYLISSNDLNEVYRFDLLEPEKAPVKQEYEKL